ncbi:MAG: radical SAM family heme chaperone HemW [Lachnospiraceae bacterium]
MRSVQLYLHIPFCVRKCAYCDFLSFPLSQSLLEEYTDALLQEIYSYKEEGRAWRVPSVFIGGGTPSLLGHHQLQRLMQALFEVFAIEGDAEITLEANPGTIHEGVAQGYRDAGINRLSLGLQSVHARELQLLGRIHTYDEFLVSYERARSAGFTNINIDLMYAIPEQTCQSWEETLREVLRLEPEHISAYSLIVEAGTPFYGQKLALPGEEEEERMYEMVKPLLLQNGYDQYEISNFARNGLACRHNKGYWTRQEYIGLGLGAASLYDARRFSNTPDLKEYLHKSAQPVQMRTAIENLSIEEEMAEQMILGLRMTAGVDTKEFAARFRKTPQEVYGDIISKHEQTGLLQNQNERVVLTERGLRLSNYVMSDFI